MSIDVEVILKKGKYLDVAIMVFMIHTMPYVCDSRSKTREISRLAVVGVYMGFIGVKIRTKGKTGFCFIGLWYIF